MGKVTSHTVARGVNLVLQEVKRLMETEEFDLACYHVGHGVSLVREGVIQTVQVVAHAGSKVQVEVLTPKSKTTATFSVAGDILPAAKFVVEQFRRKYSS